MIRLGCCHPGASVQADSPEEGLRTGWEAVQRAGFDYFEVSAGALCDLTEAEFSNLRRMRIPVECCNGFIPWNLSIFDPAKEKELRSHVEKSLSRAGALGVQIMVFGSGTARRIPDGMSREEGEKGIRDFLRMCSHMARKNGVTIAVEPLNRQESNVLNSVAEAAAMVSSLGLPEVRLLADAYHMAKENESPDILRETGSLLVHVHTAEPPDRVFPGRNGGEYLAEFSRVLREIGYGGRVTVECGFENFQQEAPQARAFLEEILR